MSAAPHSESSPHFPEPIDLEKYGNFANFATVPAVPHAPDFARASAFTGYRSDRRWTTTPTPASTPNTQSLARAERRQREREEREQEPPCVRPRPIPEGPPNAYQLAQRRCRERLSLLLGNPRILIQESCVFQVRSHQVFDWGKPTNAFESIAECRIEMSVEMGSRKKQGITDKLATRTTPTIEVYLPTLTPVEYHAFGDVVWFPSYATLEGLGLSKAFLPVSACY
ncbi:hypothetical protein B0H19DRAFT_1242575 [Mycena capillaripes]|nr:hypothetical protein B0H19DRAFT_1242575 [Mycena capillaripes]